MGIRYFIIKDDSGKTVKTFGVNQDITDKKNAELEIIKAKDKAEESDRLKTAFLLNMSHEIPTPMSGILGFASLLRKQDPGTEKFFSYIDIISRSGERLLNTVEDILEISKIEIGDIQLDYTNVNVSELMQYYHDFFKIQAEEKGLDFRIAAQLSGTERLSSFGGQWS